MFHDVSGQLNEMCGELPQARTLPKIELVAARLHDAWMTDKRNTGLYSQLSWLGEELMVPYEQLSQSGRNLHRDTVHAVRGHS